MAKKATKTKLKDDTQVQSDSAEVNAFANPSAALQEGSETQLAVMDGNAIEAPEDNDTAPEHDPMAEEARTHLKEIFFKQDSCFWTVAKDMAYIANKKSYQGWGFKTFEQFLDAEFSIGKRKGQYYVQVYNYFESSVRATLRDMDSVYINLMDKIRDVGWTKGRVLAREQVITPGNVEEVIGKLGDLGYRELETYCKSLRESMSDKDRENADDNNDMKTVRVAFQCSLPQKDDIESAIDLAMTMAGKETTRTGAMSWVARDYVSTNVAAQGKSGPEAQAETFSKFERLFGVTIIAISDDTKKVTYGQQNLDRLSGDAQ